MPNPIIKSINATISFTNYPAQKIIFVPQVIQPAPENKYILLNCINWNVPALSTLPLTDASEFTYFVLLVTAGGAITNDSASLETAFVNNVHRVNKKATFSVGGGTQDIAAIKTAVTTNRTAFINNIATHLILYGYDGVTLDIENTSIGAQAMVDFINALRAKFNTISVNLIIGCYVQQYQIDTVWNKIDQAIASLNWLSEMDYDSGVFNLDTLLSRMRAWLPKVPKEKLLAGIAVNYPVEDGGLNVTQYGQVLDLVNNGGFGGVGIWQNTLFTDPYKNIQRSKFPSIA